MYRIRFHGRGGQGMKTASRILGTAFFLEGFEVQDAPRYGAERRGAPLFAYVRADRVAIDERGVIERPDLVVAADETLLAIPSAGVLQGVGPAAVVLIRSGRRAAELKVRFPLPEKTVTLAGESAESGRQPPYVISAACAGAAAGLVGVIPEKSLKQAIRSELAGHGRNLVRGNIDVATAAYARMAPHAGLVAAGAGESGRISERPQWIDLPFEAARISAPAIHAALTSEMVPTGLWRTARPVIDTRRCRRCGLCYRLCPEGVIRLTAQGIPEIDYDHCKGCLICAAQCPARAIAVVAEERERESGGGGS